MEGYLISQYILCNSEPYRQDPMLISALNILKLRTTEFDLCLVNTLSHPVSIISSLNMIIQVKIFSIALVSKLISTGRQ